MSKSKIADIKNSVVEELRDILKELQMGVDDDTNMTSVGVRRHNLIEMVHQFSIFVNKDKGFTEEDKKEFREGEGLEKDKSALKSGLTQLDQFCEGNNIPESEKPRIINALNKLADGSKTERSDFLNEQMHELLTGTGGLFRGEEKPSHQERFHEGPLHRAVKTRNVDEVKKALKELKELNGNIDASDENFHPALVLAVKLFQEDTHAADAAIIKMLLEAGANPNGWECDGENVLTELLRSAYGATQIAPEAVEIVQLLIEHGADPNFYSWGGSDSKCGSFTLELAVGVQSVEIVDNLLQHGAFVSSRNTKDDPNVSDALHEALCYDDIPMVKMLLRWDADIKLGRDEASTHEERIRNLEDVDLIKELEDARKRVEAAAELIMNIHENPGQAENLFSNFSYPKSLKQFRYPVYQEYDFSNQIAESLLSAVMVRNPKAKERRQAKEIINSVYDNFIDKFLENYKDSELKKENLAAMQTVASSEVLEKAAEIGGTLRSHATASNTTSKQVPVINKNSQNVPTL